MRLAVDIKSLCLHRSGIAAYTLGMLRVLASAPDAGLELVLVGPSAAFDRLDEQWPFARHPVELPRRWGPLAIPFYDQVLLPLAARRLAADALFTPNCDAPVLSRRRTLVVIHDLAYRRFPLSYRRSLRWYYSGLTSWHLRRATVTLTDSRFSERELLAVHPGAAGRIVVVPCPLDRAFFGHAHAEDLRARAGQRQLPERFVLYTGGADARKEVRLVFEAMEALNRTAPAAIPLVVTSGGLPERVWRERVGRAWHAQGTVLLEAVDPDQMPLLYAAASAVVYLSRYEGFGLPVLEALAMGTSVVATRTGFLVDETPPGVELVDTHDPQVVAGALARALQAPLSCRAAARAYAERTQRDVLPALQAALKRLSAA